MGNLWTRIINFDSHKNDALLTYNYEDDQQNFVYVRRNAGVQIK